MSRPERQIQGTQFFDFFDESEGKEFAAYLSGKTELFLLPFDENAPDLSVLEVWSGSASHSSASLTPQHRGFPTKGWEALSRALSDPNCIRLTCNEALSIGTHQRSQVWKSKMYIREGSTEVEVGDVALKIYEDSLWGYEHWQDWWDRFRHSGVTGGSMARLEAWAFYQLRDIQGMELSVSLR